MKSNEKEKGREQELTGEDLARKNTKESEGGLEIAGEITVNNNEMRKEPAIKEEDGARGGLITSSRTTILRFTSHKTKIYVFTVSLKNRGGTECQKRCVSPIL